MEMNMENHADQNRTDKFPLNAVGIDAADTEQPCHVDRDGIVRDAHGDQIAYREVKMLSGPEMYKWLLKNCLAPIDLDAIHKRQQRTEALLESRNRARVI